jgi:hypothetical protein
LHVGLLVFAPLLPRDVKTLLPTTLHRLYLGGSGMLLGQVFTLLAPSLSSLNLGSRLLLFDTGL